MSSGKHLIMAASKKALATPCALMKALYLTPQMKSGFLHKLIFLTTNQFRVLSLSREVLFLIPSPKIHHTLWMSLGLLRSTIFV